MLKRKNGLHLLSWGWLAFCFLALMLFLHWNASDLINSDMSSQLVFSKHIADSGQLVPTDWYYSTEVQLLNMQIFFAPFFLLTDNWHWVRLGGMASSLLCMLVCFYYLCSQLKVRRFFPLAASALLVPFSAMYADMVLFGGFYPQYLIIPFLTLAMMIHCTKTDRRKIRITLVVILALLALLAGASGLRMIFSSTYQRFSLLLFFFCLQIIPSAIAGMKKSFFFQLPFPCCFQESVIC